MGQTTPLESSRPDMQRGDGKKGSGTRRRGIPKAVCGGGKEPKEIGLAGQTGQHPDKIGATQGTKGSAQNFGGKGDFKNRKD